MREFLINSEKLLDREALQYLKTEKTDALFPCSWVRFNEKIKLVFFTEKYMPLSAAIRSMTRDQICKAGISLLNLVNYLEQCTALTPENLTLDTDSIFLCQDYSVRCIYLPVVLPDASLSNPIYRKRVYAILDGLCKSAENGQNMRRRMDYERAGHFGNWDALIEILQNPDVEDAGLIYLKGINTPDEQIYQIGQEEFLIGSDRNQADGVLTDEASISPVHARISWEDGNFYITDMDSAGGTFVDDRKIDPGQREKIGLGTVIRFADYTFNVE